MKMFQSRKLALLLTLMLLVPLIWNYSTGVANAAASPTFTQSKIEIIGQGETQQLEIKDQVKGSKYKWSSSNTAVAKVTSKGLVTSAGKGTANIKCVITYPTKKTKTITCKVTVTVPATGIRITNATEVNGAHVLTLGETKDFETEIIPATTSDKVIWTVGGGDEACINIIDKQAGVVTATKAGKVILTATAAKDATQESADASIINDAIIIEVVGPTATVRSADIVSGNEIKVVFDSPVNANTVIGLNNKLSGNIEVTQRKDIKGVLSQDPGALTANLSTDGKILTITSVNTLSGEYGINFSSSILTTTGIALDTYYKQISFVDIFPPTILATTYDDTGMIATITFSEAIDFANFKASNAAFVAGTGSTTGTTYDVTTISTLNNTLNYVIATDKKSVSINLSKIAYTDYGKLFSVTFSGIKDKAGNAPTSFTMPVYLRVDTSMRPQARVISVIRTSYNTVTATFDRAIQTPGFISINSGSTIYGVTDTTDSKKVNYTISEMEAQYFGVKTVTIGYWSSYNVDPNDLYARQTYPFNVDFTADRTSPVLLDQAFDAATGVLTLTYNEDVSTMLPTGIFRSKLVTAGDEIKPDTNITYTVMNHTEGNKIIKLKITNMTLVGNYTFTMDAGFVSDRFKNLSLSRVITISNATGTSAELPRPLLIIQSTTNLSQIYVEFADKLDVASAQTISNYAIAGVTIISAEVTKNTSDSGATVLLTVADGGIDVTVSRPITIQGIKGYNNNYTEMTAYTVNVDLKDNKKPYFIDPLVYDKALQNTVIMKFSEAIQGELELKVTQMSSNGSIPYEYNDTITILGSNVYINLGAIPVNNALLKVEITKNTLKDASGNAVSALPPTMYAAVQY